MLKPMIPYFGGKWRAAKKYGRPNLKLVVEPFAGGAGYSLYHEPSRVILVEKNEVVAGIWNYLINVSPSEIRALPVEFETVAELKISLEARALIGFWSNGVTARPYNRRFKRAQQYHEQGKNPGSLWSNETRERIALQVDRIRHWEIICGPYESAPDVSAHWFIDPPYSVAGSRYPERITDYSCLAAWCNSRQGFVQVCENAGADWLPFTVFERRAANAGSGRTKPSIEMIYQRTTQ